MWVEGVNLDVLSSTEPAASTSTTIRFVYLCVCVWTELNSVELQGCSSDNSLNSNASLPSVQSHRRHTERRVASWAVCFERLLQDPVGVRYFSVLQQHMTGVGQHIHRTDNRLCFPPTIKRTFNEPRCLLNINKALYSRKSCIALLEGCAFVVWQISLILLFLCNNVKQNETSKIDRHDYWVHPCHTSNLLYY